VVLVPDEAILRLASLSVEFRQNRQAVLATSNLSLALSPGRILGVVGESGSGKSVTVRAMLGLLPSGAHVTAGTLYWHGNDYEVADVRKMRRLCGVQFGFIPQDPFGALNPRLTVRTQFRSVLKLAGQPRSDLDGLAADALSRVGIMQALAVLRRYPFELSGGMAQRVVIALALARGPEILLADEPTTGLDSTVQQQVLSLISSVLDVGAIKAAVLVTHDLGVVAHYCADMTVVYKGKVVEAGPVREILHSPAHPYTRSLIGAVTGAKQPGPLGSRAADLETSAEGGCAFRARCVHRMTRCSSIEPELTSAGPGRLAACHLVEGGSEWAQPSA
jgi:oligopeptide/dipeptide ABC transporter ATP-binding protein